jgi:phage shock protein A
VSLDKQVKTLAQVVMDLSDALEVMSANVKKLADNHNELVEAVNDTTEWRAQLDAEWMEAEAILDCDIVFTPDFPTDKKKIN